MSKIKLTNTWKYTLVAITFGLIVWFVDYIVHTIDSQAMFEMGWMSMFVFTGGALLWEAFYKSKNHIDTAVDVLVANGVFCLVLWACGVI